MKNSILKTVFIALLLVVCASCSSDDDAGNPITDDFFLTAKVDGVDFEVLELLGATTTSEGFINEGNEGTTITTISAAYEDDSRLITIGIVNLTTPGTYLLFDDSILDPITDTYVSLFGYAEGESFWVSGLGGNVSGSVTITEVNADYLSGTFNFIAFNAIDQTEKTISDGRFRIKKFQLN